MMLMGCCYCAYVDGRRVDRNNLIVIQSELFLW